MPTTDMTMSPRGQSAWVSSTAVNLSVRAIAVGPARQRLLPRESRARLQHRSDARRALVIAMVEEVARPGQALRLAVDTPH